MNPLRDEELRPFRSGLWFGFFNAINWQVALGTPMVLLAEALGASPFQVGLAWSFVYVLVPVQVLATPLLARFGYRRTMLLGWSTRGIFLLPPIGLAVLAHFGWRGDWMVWVLIGSVFGYTGLRALGSGAWMPWLYAIVPDRLRGRYFASDQVMSGAASLATLVIGALLFQLLPLHPAFVLVYALAGVGTLLSLRALRAIPDGPRPDTIRLQRALGAAPGILWGPSPYRGFLWASCAFAAATSGLVPFCAYYLRNELRFGGNDILLLETLRYGGVMLGSFLIRGEIDRLGPRPFLLTALLSLGGFGVYWLLAVGADAVGGGWLHLSYLVLGLGSGAWIAAQLKHLPAVVPDEDRTLILAIYGAATSLAAGLSTVAWGLPLRAEGPDGAARMDVGMFVVYLALAVGALVLLAAALRRLPAPSVDRPRLELGPGLLRPQRAFTYLVNLVDASLGDRR